MFDTVALPFWLVALTVCFAVWALIDRIMLPSVRWFLRRRLERVVARVNKRLARPIQPFKLARRHDTIQRLIYDPAITRAIVEHCRESGEPESVAFERARRYAREIVPAFSASVYFGFATRAARWFSRICYRVELSEEGQQQLAALDPDATIVFVMNHRSNMDYVLVTYLAARASALSYAVGEWARVWPLTWLIKAMGGYFIRRNSGDPLYRAVLARYVALAVEGGVTQAMFPEGRLSVDGALKPPKVGLLKYIADAQIDAERDVIFVPAAINYDRVVEDTVLLRAQDPAKRGFRLAPLAILKFLARQLWLILRLRWRRFGVAAVALGQPLSLRAFRAEAGETLVPDLGAALMARIGARTPVIGAPLVSYLLQQGPATREQLEARWQDAQASHAGLAAHVPDDLCDEILNSGLETLERRHIVRLRDGIWRINPQRDELAVYYANSIRHLLDAPAAQDAASAKS